MSSNILKINVAFFVELRRMTLFKFDLFNLIIKLLFFSLIAF